MRLNDGSGSCSRRRRRELLRHDVVLRNDLAVDDRPVTGDRVQLLQVLLNLIMNGVEAMRGVTERTRELTVSSTFAEQTKSVFD